jgi:hypothetical protein
VHIIMEGRLQSREVSTTPPATMSQVHGSNHPEGITQWGSVMWEDTSPCKKALMLSAAHAAMGIQALIMTNQALVHCVCAALSGLLAWVRHAYKQHRGSFGRSRHALQLFMLICVKASMSPQQLQHRRAYTKLPATAAATPSAVSWLVAGLFTSTDWGTC